MSHYRAFHPKSLPRPHSGMKEWRKIRDRLKEGYTVERLCAAIDGCHLSEWHSGKNDRRKKYQSLELIVRDATHVEDFEAVAREAKEREAKKKAEPPPTEDVDRAPADVARRHAEEFRRRVRNE